MRKFILMLPLLFLSAGAVAAPGLTFAANETIEQIKPAEKPVVNSEPSTRTKARTNTGTSTNSDEPARNRKMTRRSANSRSARKPSGIPGRLYGNEEEEARRLGAKYGVTW